MRSAQLFRNENIIRLLRFFWESPRSQKFGRNVLDKQKQESATTTDPYEGNYGFLDCDRQMKVTVIGAAGRVGKTLSLLLKTCPLIDQLCLFDIDKSVRGIGVDISHIDTKCCVSYVCGMRNIQQALNNPDVVIITAGCPASPNLTGKKLFDKNAPIVAGLSEACARFCPKACVVLITNPINSLLPVMGEVYQIITNQIPSKKMFGLTTLDVVRANTFVAEVIRKDPNNVIVPVIGGTSQETIVPVISQMKPCCKIKRGEMIALTECLKRAEDNLADCQNCGTRGSSTLSTAYAGFRFTSSLVSALKGAEDIIECAFVRSTVLPELEYLASPVKLGVHGIEHNFGYPPLSDYELAGLEQSVVTLQSDIKMGKVFVASIEDTIQRGLIWKRLPIDHVKEEPISDGKDAFKRLQEERNEQKRLKMEEERRRRKEMKKKELEVVPTSLTQEVYSEGVRNWAVKSSLKQFFKEQDGNCEEVVRDSVPTELDSDSCKDDKSEAVSVVPLAVYLNNANNLEELLGEKPPKIPARPFTKPLHPKLLKKFKRSNQHARGLHTGRSKLIKNKYEKYLKEDREKTLTSVTTVKNAIVPVSQTVKAQEGFVRNIEVSNAKTNLFKNMNFTARQKYRSYNMQKKILPNPLYMLVLNKGKTNNRNVEMIVCTPEKKTEDEAEEEKDVESVSSEGNELIVQEESDEVIRYKNLILDQLRQLKKENDELKKRMSMLSQDKILEAAIQVQNHSLELERTKLKAGWLVMTSTMDAFTNFCKRFLKKTDAQVENEKTERETMEEEDEEEEEIYDDALENLEEPKKHRKVDYDEKYFKFLEKLMEGQSETRLDTELKRNRVVK